MSQFAQGYAFLHDSVVVGRVSELKERDKSAALSLAVALYLKGKKRPTNTTDVENLAADVKKRVIQGDFDAPMHRVVAMVRQRRLDYYNTHKREFYPATKTTRDEYLYSATFDAQDVSHILCAGVIDTPYLRRVLPHVDERKMKDVVEREENRRTYIQQRPFTGYSIYVQKTLPKSDGFGLEPVFFNILTDCFNQDWKREENCVPYIIDNGDADSGSRHVCGLPYTGHDCLPYLLVFETGMRHISETGVVSVPVAEKELASALGHGLPSSPSKHAQMGVNCRVCQTVHTGDMHTAYNQ